MSRMECAGKRVIVTAGAAGIGLAIARAFAAKGARVHVCDLAEAALAALSGSDPGIVGHRADVADEAAMDRFMADAIAALGGLDVLVNNAGMAGPTARIEAIAFADWRRTLSVNLDSMFLATRRAVPALVAAGGGAIVNMASVAGRLGVPLRLPYATSKFGVVGLTETLAMELGPRGISVNAILPGPVEGERLERVLTARAEELGSTVEEARAAFVRKISLRTTVTANEIADMAVYLACGPGRRISGQSISVCGNVETLGED
jgi:NAD(P)-dependent dehydrogenase (short-subunit alcohol dehydrogenase family)